jgi:hypothetical protein
MTINLVFDTNVLRHERLVSRNMQLLARLSKSGEVAVSVPSIIQREYQSQRTLEIRDQLDKAQKAISEMGRQLEPQNPVHASISELTEKLKATAVQATEAVPIEFNTWLAALDAAVLEFAPDSIAAVLDEYFSGEGAFRKPKHRDDFPDAIASHEIRTLLQRTDRVHVACKDGAFNNHLRAERRYTLVEGLDQFFDLPEVREILTRLDAQDQHVAALTALFSRDDFRKNLTAYLEKAKDLLESVYIEADELEGLESLEVESWGESLNYARSQSISSIDYGSVTYIDKGHFSLEVEIHTNALLHFACDYSQAQDIAIERGAEMWSMDGDGVSEMRERRNVSLSGHVELRFDPRFDPREIEIHAQYLMVTPPKINIDLDIQRATVY